MALEAAAAKKLGQDRLNTQTMISILEDKRAEVMAHEEAGYFIHDWQELRDQVRQMIMKDNRYVPIKAGRTENINAGTRNRPTSVNISSQRRR